jgi:hypothetical protein
VRAATKVAYQHPLKPVEELSETEAKRDLARLASEIADNDRHCYRRETPVHSFGARRRGTPTPRFSFGQIAASIRQTY